MERSVPLFPLHDFPRLVNPPAGGVHAAQKIAFPFGGVHLNPSITVKVLSYSIPMNGRDRGTSWSVTCNLKTVARSTVDACIDRARAEGWGVEGQIEEGEEGTQHYQLLVKTPQVRFSAVKKVFPTAHIELARNVKALQQYVHKEDTRVEALRTVEVSFLTYAQVRDRFFEWLYETQFIAMTTNDHDERLALWDRFIGLSIEEGMNCDLIGMNPQQRGCIAKYWRHYIARVANSRQTEERSQLQTDSQDVYVPTFT